MTEEKESLKKDDGMPKPYYPKLYYSPEEVAATRAELEAGRLAQEKEDALNITE